MSGVDDPFGGVVDREIDESNRFASFMPVSCRSRINPATGRA
ncbi:hypothetical protein QZM22_02555 [Burkholderia oklahomensis]|nr:hypothetical protein [Burkholderia oklahomensis]